MVGAALRNMVLAAQNGQKGVKMTTIEKCNVILESEEVLENCVVTATYNKLFVDTLYCELTDEYATTDILFTPTSDSFASKYSSYKYHDGTKLNFDIEVNSMNNNGASVTITIK